MKLHNVCNMDVMKCQNVAETKELCIIMNINFNTRAYRQPTGSECVPPVGAHNLSLTRAFLGYYISKGSII